MKTGITLFWANIFAALWNSAHLWAGSNLPAWLHTAAASSNIIVAYSIWRTLRTMGRQH